MSAGNGIGCPFPTTKSLTEPAASSPYLTTVTASRRELSNEWPLRIQSWK